MSLDKVSMLSSYNICVWFGDFTWLQTDQQTDGWTLILNVGYKHGKPRSTKLKSLKATDNVVTKMCIPKYSLCTCHSHKVNEPEGTSPLLVICPHHLVYQHNNNNNERLQLRLLRLKAQYSIWLVLRTRQKSSWNCTKNSRK